MIPNHSGSLVSGKLQDDALIMTIQAEQIRDPETSMALRSQMISLVDQMSSKDLVIDFGQVRFMGSIGFLALMALRRHLTESRIVLCGLSEPLSAAFQACSLIANSKNKEVMFETADTEQNAISALQS